MNIIVHYETKNRESKQTTSRVDRHALMRCARTHTHTHTPTNLNVVTAESAVAQWMDQWEFFFNEPITLPTELSPIPTDVWATQSIPTDVWAT